MTFFALVLNRPMVLMCCFSAFLAQRDHLLGRVDLGGTARRVALFTPTSVACADSATATSSV